MRLLTVSVGLCVYGVWRKLHPHRVIVTPVGQSIHLRASGFKTETEAAMPELKGQFLVVGVQEVEAPFAEGTLSVIPLGEVPALEKKFPNFLHCENDGSFVAGDKVIDLMVVLTSKVVRVEFAKLLKLYWKKEYRPYRIVARLGLQDWRVATESGGVEVQLSGITHVYLLNELGIVREDYRTPGYENDRGRRIHKVINFY